MDVPTVIPDRDSPASNRRRTRWSVRVIDRIARIVITFGGIGTILAVCGVALFLVLVAAPIFRPATIAPASSVAQATSPTQLQYLAVDEDRRVALQWTKDGEFQLIDLLDGKSALEQPIVPSSRPTAYSAPDRHGIFALGFEDGSIRIGELRFEDTFPEEDDPAVGLDTTLAVGEHRIRDRVVISRTPKGFLRVTQTALEVGPATQTGEAAAIAQLDHVVTPAGVVTLTLSASNRLALHKVRERTSRIDGSVSTVHVSTEIARENQLPAEIAFVRLAGQGTQAFVVAKSGEIRRFNLSNPSGPVLAETIPPTAGAGDIVACEWAKGRETLIVATTSGRITGSFLTRVPSDNATDGQSFQTARVYRESGPAPVTLVAATSDRCFATLTADGTISVFQVTTSEHLCDHELGTKVQSARLAITPRTDGILVMREGQFDILDLNIGYPEASLAAMFLPVWYEGYPKPEYVWQSSSDGEPKFSLVPLIFGTMKATVYSMIFGVPLALMAALFTSEFLKPSVKARIKPTIELMASLPSVVLGFTAAFLLAPFVAGRLPEVLALFVTIPWTFLLVGHLWQMLPTPIRLRLLPYRFSLMLINLPLGIGLAALVGPIIEQTFFAGNLFQWLDGQIGSGTSGWMFLCLPASCIATAWAFSRTIDPILRVQLAHASHAKASAYALARFLIGTVLAIGVAWVVSAVLNTVGWDPRGSFLGTYDQRNALIVGFVMGFAIIPIIYTIADDALSTVPEHLRSASLGAGATTWQTATWIVLPTAMSGIFSAVMVGLGRAVGETMIVLMAAGGTPIMDWNPFNGFKTLSVNIANELPEAAVGSTHYRILFFSAVVLFLLTSVLNTVAELVRIRFRRRAFQL